MSNTTQIYKDAINFLKEEDKREDNAEEIKEQKELRYINFNLQQTCIEIKNVILERQAEIDSVLSHLILTPNNEYTINRNLLEKTVLNRVLNLIKTGKY